MLLFKRPRLRHGALAAAASLMLASGGGVISQVLAQQGAQILNQLKTPYTDSSLFDVEIPILNVKEGRILGKAGSTLRLKLSRPYIVSFTTAGLQSFVQIQLDIDSNEPWAVVSPPERRYAKSEQRPGLDRMLTVSIDNAKTIEGIRYQNSRLAACVGDKLDSGLYKYDPRNRKYCFRPAFPNGEKFIAEYDDALSLVVECTGQWSNVSPCSMPFPFGELSVELTFDRSRLKHWRDILYLTQKFLRLKQQT